MFSEKLNFLMNLTNTLNSSLALAISLDASHISRLRHGSRKLPKNAGFVMPMAKYFAKHIENTFQQNTIADVLHIETFPRNSGEVARLIHNWLVSNDSTSSTEISAFLTGFSKADKTAKIPDSELDIVISKVEDNHYYGIEGKQNAVIRFLSDVLKCETPQTLHLFSDEDMSWLTEDNEFSEIWASLMLSVMKKGNRIQIIHTVSRNLDEMINALIKWLPLYMTGMIEPYYYPKLHGGVFKRTIFVAPKTSAIVSNSVKADTSKMLNIYIDTPNAVSAIETEYQRYLEMCKPLMSIMNVVSKDRFLKEFSDFQNIDAPTILYTPVPSLVTIPKKVISSLSKQSSNIQKIWENSKTSFDKVTLKNSFIEILTPTSVEQGHVPFPLCDMFSIKEFNLSLENYADALRNALMLAKENPNYKVLFSNSDLKDITICVKEDVGAFIIKPSAPTAVFAFSDSYMITAMWSYLSEIADDLSRKGMKNIKKIESIIENLNTY